MALRYLLPMAMATAASAVAIAPSEQMQAAERDASSEGQFFSLPIYHERRTTPLIKRDSSVELFNISSVSYLIELSIGTPGQKTKVAIDTGSDELWVDPICTGQDLDQDQTQECQANGKYTPTSSSSAKRLSGSHDIPYGKGEVLINYYTDDITMPGSDIKLSNVQFGVATQSQDLNEGILGLGYGRPSNLNYNNIVEQLTLQNQTASTAFSVALGSVDADNGGILIFGGVDTKKFTGKLVSNKILGPQGGENINRYWIQMSSIALNMNGNSKTYSGGNTPIVLDTGSSLSYLPSQVLTAMAADFNGQFNKQAGLYIVPCSETTKSGTVDFAFGSVTIKVPFKEFIWQIDSSTCVLGASSADDGSGGTTALLGDTFLRSAFVVFDQTTGTISMAQYANCGQAEQNIPSGGVGDLQGQCDESSSGGSGGSNSSSSNNPKNAAGKMGYSSFGLAVALLVGAITLL